MSEQAQAPPSSEAAPQAALLGSLDAPATESPAADSPAPDAGAAAAGDSAGASEQSESATEVPAGDEKAGAPAAKPAEKQDTVPHGALHEARSEIKQLRAKLAELEAKPALTPEQSAALAKLSKADAAEAEADPDFLADPKGYVDAQQKKIGDAVKKLEDQTKEQADQSKAQQALQGLINATAQAEATFVEQNPDYADALTHVRAVRTDQLRMIHPDATDEQIRGAVAQEELAIAHQVLTRKGNPAEFIYGFAKTMGYTKKAAAAAPAARRPVDKDAARTMGSGGAADDAPESDAGSGMPELMQAVQERFQRPARRR